MKCEAARGFLAPLFCFLYENEDDRSYGSQDQQGCDKGSIPHVLVRHVDPGKRREKQPDRDDQKKDLQGKGMMLLPWQRLRNSGFGARRIERGGCCASVAVLRGSSRPLVVFFRRRIGPSGVSHWLSGDRDDGGLFLVNLTERDDPRTWLVGASTRGFVQAKRLKSAGKGEKDQSRCRKDSQIKMQQAADPQESM